VAMMLSAPDPSAACAAPARTRNIAAATANTSYFAPPTNEKMTNRQGITTCTAKCSLGFSSRMAAAIRWSPGLLPDFHAMEQAFVVGERQPHLN